MSVGSELSAAEAYVAHIRLLEEALAEYAARYGLTERARALLVGPCAGRPFPGVLVEPADTR